MKQKEVLGVLDPLELLRKAPVGHVEGKGRQSEVHQDRRKRRAKQRLRKELEVSE